MYKRGKLLGLENRLKGVNDMLGPSVGPLGKLPAGGRNWEGFGSDPVLQGWAAAQTIKGIQEEGVIATIKHFIGNEQEHFRQSCRMGIAKRGKFEHRRQNITRSICVALRRQCASGRRFSNVFV